MKILVWAQNFWPESFRINELIQQLCEKGHDVTVLTGKPNYPHGHIYPSFKLWGIERNTCFGAEVIRLPLIPRGKASGLNLILNYLSFVISGYIFAPFVLKSKKFDVVFVYATSPLLQALPAAFISRLKRAKLSIWVQDLWPDSLEATGFIKNKFLLKIISKIVKYIYSKASSILIQSEAFKHSIEPFVMNKKPIFFLPNIAKDFSEKNASSQKALDIAQELSTQFSLVFAGNIGHAQSVETIVSAADFLQSYQDIKFYLIGGGNRTRSISDMIKEKNLKNVVMTGWLPYSDMNVIFTAASGLILCLRNHQALSKTVPSKLQDYLSAGRPIIGSINGEGAKLISEAKVGYSSPAEDPLQLANRVTRLYSLTQEERDQLSKNGRLFYESQFLPSKVTEKLIGHFQSLH